MLKALKPCKKKRRPQLGDFATHAHPFVKFIWQDIIERDIELTSVANAAGIDRSTLHKWRKVCKGPYLMQLEEVLTVLGYRLEIVRADEK